MAVRCTKALEAVTLAALLAVWRTRGAGRSWALPAQGSRHSKLNISFHETGIREGAAWLCAPVHESVCIDDVDTPLYLPAVHAVHSGSAVVVPPFCVNLPAVHLVCSAA